MGSMIRLLMIPCVFLALGCASQSDTLPDSGFPLIRQAASKYAPTPAGQNQRLLDQGYAHYWKGDFARAITQWESAFLLEEGASPQQWGRYLLYYCYMATGRYGDALKLASALANERPNESLSYQQVGLAQLWLGQSALAIKNFRRALEFESHDPVVYYYLGIALEKRGRLKERDAEFKKAEREMRAMLKSNPFDFQTNYELANLLIRWKRSPNLVQAAVKATKDSLKYEGELAPERSVYERFYLAKLEGIAAHLTRQTARSQELLYQALSHAPSGIRPELAETYLFMGKNFAALGNPTNALNFLDRALLLDPKGPHAAQVRQARRAIEAQKKISP